MRKLSALLLIVVSVSACSKPKAAEDADAAKPTASVQLAKVERRTIRQLLDLNGSFLPSQGTSARLTPGVAGRVANVLVKEGQRVKKGELLATLDIAVQQNQSFSARAAAVAAQAQAAQSQLTLRATQADQVNAVQTAEIALKQAKLESRSEVTQAALGYEGAKADLAKIRAGARPQELAQVHEATVQAQAARDRAASEYSRNKELWPSGYVSKRQLEDAKTTLETAQSALTAAQANESLVKEGARPEDLEAAEAKTAAARDALDSAKSIGSAKIAAAVTALNQAKAGRLSVDAKAKEVSANQALAQQKQADLSTAGATESLGQIRAPYDGTVTHRLLNPGDSADVTSAVIEIESSSARTDFVASAMPSQSQMIAPGMTASIQVGDRVLDARVMSVAPPDVQSGLSSVRISVAGKVLSGTYGTAQIVLSKQADSLSVPDAALVDHDGKMVVFVDADSVAKQTEVKTGPSDGGFTSIQSGLKEGDQVVVLGGYELDDGTKITAEPEKKGAEDSKD